LSSAGTLLVVSTPIGHPDQRVAVPKPDHDFTLPSLLRRAAERFGERELVVDGTRRLTYCEVERRSGEWARGLLAAGLGKGSRVGLLMPNGPDWIIAFLAAARIGALVVPLSTFYRARELAEVLRHADIHTVLSCARHLSHDYLERLEQAAPELAGISAATPLYLRSLPQLRQVRIWGECDRDWAIAEPGGLEAQAAAASGIDEALLRGIESDVSPADPALVIYTSGSSAAPKGIVHSHGTAVRHSYVVGRYFHTDLHPGDRMYTTQPFFWVGGLGLCVLGCLHAGAALHCDAPLDSDGILDLILRERITHVLAMGHTTRALFGHPRFASEDLSFVRFGLVRRTDERGMPVPPERVPDRLGMTESFGQHSLEATGVLLDADHAGSFGHGLPGIERRIVDPQTGEPALPGQLGELWIRGYSLMQGMYKREREEVFEPDGFYRTGDLCRIDRDGHVYFEGRIDEMVKVRGANVSPREVEAVLESFAEVDRAGVIGLQAAAGAKLAAGVTLAPDASLSADALRERLRDELSVFKIPEAIVLLGRDELPLTPSEKIRRPQLRELLQRKLYSP
jgi:acyl-CoA synthetase (AMP-forming)/AMP-acid ligase II